MIPATRVLLSVVLLSTITLAQARVERNVIYGMYSGTALLMDVHYPIDANGLGVIFVAEAIPHEAADIQLVVQDSGAAGGIAVNGAGFQSAPPGPGQRSAFSRFAIAFGDKPAA